MFSGLIFQKPKAKNINFFLISMSDMARTKQVYRGRSQQQSRDKSPVRDSDKSIVHGSDKPVDTTQQPPAEKKTIEVYESSGSNSSSSSSSSSNSSNEEELVETIVYLVTKYVKQGLEFEIVRQKCFPTRDLAVSYFDKLQKKMGYEVGPWKAWIPSPIFCSPKCQVFNKCFDVRIQVTTVKFFQPAKK